MCSGRREYGPAAKHSLASFRLRIKLRFITLACTPVGFGLGIPASHARRTAPHPKATRMVRDRGRPQPCHSWQVVRPATEHSSVSLGLRMKLRFMNAWPRPSRSFASCRLRRPGLTRASHARRTARHPKATRMVRDRGWVDIFAKVRLEILSGRKSTLRLTHPHITPSPGRERADKSAEPCAVWSPPKQFSNWCSISFPYRWSQSDAQRESPSGGGGHGGRARQDAEPEATISNEPLQPIMRITGF